MNESNINEEIGKRIKIRREQLGMSQLELSEKLGMKDRSSISRYEKGKREFRQSQISSLANALNTTPSYLLGWDEEISMKEELKAILKKYGYDELDESKMDSWIAMLKYLINCEDITL